MTRHRRPAGHATFAQTTDFMDDRPSRAATLTRVLAWLTGFTLSNAAIAVAIASLNVPFGSGTLGWKGALFLGLALPGHFLFFGALLGLLPLALGWALRSTRAATVLAVIVQTLWICLLIADAKVYALYRFHLNAMVANMVFGGALQEQVSFSAGMWGMIALALTLLVLVEAAMARVWWHLLERQRTPSAARAWLAAAAIMVLGQGMLAYNDARGDRTVLAQLPYIPWAQPITMKDTLHRLGVKADPGLRLPDARDNLLDYPRKPLECPGRPELNVLVVLVESLRKDALSPQVMPETWRFAQQAQWFQNHYSAGNATRFGLFGLLYGLPGGYWHSMLADQRGSVFINEMKREQYAMHIYGSAPLYSPEFDRTVFAQVRDRIVNGPSEMKSWQRDRYILDRLKRDIRSHPAGQRFFGFVFFDSPHGPYHIPPDFISPFQPMAQDVNFLKLGPDHDPTPEHNRYRTAVRYTDGLIGELLDTVRASHLADNTVVVVTGDHGEEFNDLKLNYWGHNGNFSDYQLGTPFVLYWPGKTAHRYEQVSSHEDLVPTLMRHVLQCRNPIGDYATGHDLFDPPQPNRPLVVESWSRRGIREGDRIFLFDNYGSASVLGRDYRPVPDAKVDPVAVSRAWEMLTRFQRR